MDGALATLCPAPMSVLSMSRGTTVDKDDIVRRMLELADLQEHAIHQHPAKVAAVYVKCRDAFMESQRSAEGNEWSRSTFLAPDELLLMHRYMLSSSFISAWYHLRGDRSKRDQAAHSCCILMAGLGFDPELTLRTYIEHEQLWRLTMRHEGVAPRPVRGVGLFVVLAIIGIILYLIFAE